MTRSDQPSSFPSTLSPTHNRIDPATGIKPIALWGPECARGWISDVRFGPGDAKVIKRQPRKRRPASAGY